MAFADLPAGKQRLVDAGGDSPDYIGSLSLDTSAALEASSISKASAGTLYGFSASSTNAGGHWIQFFDSPTLPADTTVPTVEFAIGGEGTASGEWPNGREFLNGIVWCISSTNGAKTIAGATALVDVNFE